MSVLDSFQLLGTSPGVAARQALTACVKLITTSSPRFSAGCDDDPAVNGLDDESVPASSESDECVLRPTATASISSLKLTFKRLRSAKLILVKP